MKTLIGFELRQSRTALLVWSLAISLLLAVCVLIYPEMGDDMGQVSQMFSDMGSFSAAFGMDKINFGEFVGFFGIECGNVLGLGGAFFAALLGISALAKEEKEHTAEFLLTHPVTRTKIIAAKLTALMAQIVLLNLIAAAVTAFSVFAIGEDVPKDIMGLLFLAYFLMQVETAAVTFGISAFLKRGSMGIGLGLAAVFYFLNIISNLMEELHFLKYFTPFGYTDSADIIAEKALPGGYLAAGMVFAAAGVIIAFQKYGKKDIDA